MKKRILSMLLLVAMVVTALPLMVLPTLAAEEQEEKIYTEADYNNIYVLSGMVAGVDFYSTNQYWGGKEKTATTSAAAKKLVDTYIYPGSATFGNPPLVGSNFVIKDGYVDLTYVKGEWQFSNVEALMGYGAHGSASELVRMIGSSSTVTIPSINSLRIHVDASTGKVTQIQNSSHTMYKDAAAVKAANKLGTDFVFDTFKGAIHTYTANM